MHDFLIATFCLKIGFIQTKGEVYNQQMCNTKEFLLVQFWQLNGFYFIVWILKDNLYD